MATVAKFFIKTFGCQMNVADTERMQALLAERGMTAADRAEDASVMRLPPETWGLQVNIVGRSFGRTAITFQCMVVPPTRYGLKLDFNPPAP